MTLQDKVRSRSGGLRCNEMGSELCSRGLEQTSRALGAKRRFVPNLSKMGFPQVREGALHLNSMGDPSRCT
jgi:hypothetical protein